MMHVKKCAVELAPPDASSAPRCARCLRLAAQFGRWASVDLNRLSMIHKL